MRIGFTGTRDPLPDAQDRGLSVCLSRLRRRGADVLHHGDCVGGDATAHEWGEILGYELVIHPPTAPKLRAWCEAKDVREPKGYWARNRDIVLEVDELVACPKAGTTIEDWKRSGTWYTIRYAHQRMLPVHLIWADGTYELLTNDCIVTTS